VPDVVFDTMIFVRALINPFGLCGRLVFQHVDGYNLFLSPNLTDEIHDVINRPELRRKFRHLTPQIEAEFRTMLGQVRVIATPVIPAISRDPKDDKVLALAAMARATYIVTDDQDLLVLKHHATADIVTPAAFLDLLLADEEV